MTASATDNDIHWFAMRDLTRRNAKMPGYKLLTECRFEVFTPMMRRLTTRHGRRVSEEVPFMQDLLFVRASREELNPVVAKTPTLQYRYVHGGFCEPMIVPDGDMQRFINAVKSCESPRYFRIDEITPDMYGRYVRIVGGSLDGYEGHLLAARGSKFRRLIVELPNCMAAAIEVQPDLIEVIQR